MLEDTDFGYDGPGDSPAYSRPRAGGTVTTYLGDTVHTGTAAVWQLVDLHGDVVGTTDAAGAFTAHPAADEFGRGEAPADRLGWLGGRDRFNVGGSLGLIRMGVRLYDTRTGRFASVDPVEGGNVNDYVYPTDPVNQFDLSGKFCLTGVASYNYTTTYNAKKKRYVRTRTENCRSPSRGAGRATRAVGRGAVVVGRSAARNGVQAVTVGWKAFEGCLAGAALGGYYGGAVGANWGRPDVGIAAGAGAGCVYGAVANNLTDTYTNPLRPGG